ncbi:MAG: hypothetical protein COB42_08170 [Sulfurimonas sp.]|nr:MAG: hypothetical protein COB42_08170 [Sulfurimonas sp.]
MKEIEKVFHRIRETVGIKNDSQIAKFLGLQSIANQKSRDSIPYSEIIKKAELGKYHLDYIFLGLGEKAPQQISLVLDEQKNKFEEMVDSKELALLLQNLIKYGNKDLYENISERLQKIKDISSQ